MAVNFRYLFRSTSVLARVVEILADHVATEAEEKRAAQRAGDGAGAAAIEGADADGAESDGAESDGAKSDGTDVHGSESDGEEPAELDAERRAARKRAAAES